MARSIQTLQAKGLSIVEYPQVLGNLTQMGTTLSEFINGRKLHLYPATDLREHSLNAVAIESVRGWKIAKEKASGKVDALVALAMACRAAVEAGNVGVVALSVREIRECLQQAAGGNVDAPTYTERTVMSWDEFDDDSLPAVQMERMSNNA